MDPGDRRTRVRRTRPVWASTVSMLWGQSSSGDQPDLDCRPLRTKYPWERDHLPDGLLSKSFQNVRLGPPGQQEEGWWNVQPPGAPKFWLGGRLSAEPKKERVAPCSDVHCPPHPSAPTSLCPRLHPQGGCLDQETTCPPPLFISEQPVPTSSSSGTMVPILLPASSPRAVTTKNPNEVFCAPPLSGLLYHTLYSVAWEQGEVYSWHNNTASVWALSLLEKTDPWKCYPPQPQPLFPP